MWQHDDLEPFEAISQDDETKRIFLRLAAMSQDGRLPEFLLELAVDPDLDDELKASLAELAGHRSFLFAVEDYVRSTEHFH